MVEVTQEDRDAAQALCASGWTHAIAAFARHRTTALAAKEAENAELRAKVENLREAARNLHVAVNSPEGFSLSAVKSASEAVEATLTETQPDETGRGVSGPPDRGEETANATATAPDLSGTQP